ncbi:hypothetical protein MRS44_003750 [Fusarium solani]|uniref:uncharacterized protein n=1 Tax=Fusarium solani TaxID=169388 RepID=UPI0032C4739E|nr:hypothetical protein MRS44_003750 [Fusarium solani]
MADLSNKVFIVTSATSGIGLAAAKLLVTRNASVRLCDINESGLNSLVKDLDPRAKTRATRERFGKLNGFVNFAGVAGHHLGAKNIWKMPDEEYDHIMDANVKAMEDGEQGIRGNAVMPGAIDTPMRQKLIDEDAPPPILFSPIERPGHPNEIASVVAFFLSDESSYVTGALWSVNGGVNA